MMKKGFVLREAYCTNCGYDTRSRTPEALKEIIIEREKKRHDTSRAEYCDKRTMVIVVDDCWYDEVPVA